MGVSLKRPGRRIGVEDTIPPMSHSPEEAMTQRARSALPCLVFDLGGVVFRWQPDEFLTRLLPLQAPDRAAGKRLAAEFFQGFGGDWAEFDRGRIETGLLGARIAARLGLAPEDARRVIDAVPAELQTIPETAALLQRLKAAGQRLFFLSNMPEPYARHLLAHRDVMRCFERGVFSHETGRIKPEPWLFDHACGQFGVTCGDLLFVDDLQANVDAARRAGWRALTFENAGQCETELRDLGFLPGDAVAC